MIIESRYVSLHHSGTALRVLAQLSVLGRHWYVGHRQSTAELAVAITAESTSLVWPPHPNVWVIAVVLRCGMHTIPIAATCIPRLSSIRFQ